MNRTHLAMALAFLGLLLHSAVATRRAVGLAPTPEEIDWAAAAFPWLTPAVALAALLVGHYAHRRWFARPAEEVGHVDPARPGDMLVGRGALAPEEAPVEPPEYKPGGRPPKAFGDFYDEVLVKKLLTRGSTGDTVLPTSIEEPERSGSHPHPIGEVRMHVSDFRAGDRVVANGALYRGAAVVERLEGGKVKCRRADGSKGLLCYSQHDIDLGRLAKAHGGAAAPAQAPAAPAAGRLSPSSFAPGERVAVSGDSARGEGTVQKPRRDGVVTVRLADGRIFSFDQADLNAGKVGKIAPAIAVAKPVDLPKAEAPAKTGAIALGLGEEATITVGDLVITVRRAAKA